MGSNPDKLEDPICEVCKKKAKKRVVWVKIKKSDFDQPIICICEKCVFRLPYDLQSKIIRNIDDASTNKMVVDALKNSSHQLKLNTGFCVLLEGSPMHQFHKFGSGCSLKHVKKAVKAIDQGIYAIYENGCEIT